LVALLRDKFGVAVSDTAVRQHLGCRNTETLNIF
jgi:hypothetical protein